MKVALVFPPNPYPHSPFAFGFPLGLGYLASALEKANHEVALYDACSNNATLHDVRNWLGFYRPDVLGISVYTALAKAAVSVATIAKDLGCGIATVAGGSHATYDAPNLLSRGFDFVFKGDSELSFTSMVDKLWQLQPKQVIDSQPIEDLDLLPFPAYHLVDFQRYIRPMLLPNAISIMSSRGCSHRCAFCSQYQSKWQARSPANVVKEIIYLLDHYNNIQSIQFYDDNFTLNKKRVYELCNLLIETGLNRLKWCCLARVDQVDMDMLSKMKEAGCVKVSYGIESGSDTILANIHKGLDKKKANKAFEMTTSLGIEALAFFMIGLPGETKSTLKESVRYAKSLKSTSTLWAITQVYPGTELANHQPRFDFVDYTYTPEVLEPFPFTHPSVKVFEQEDMGREELKKTQSVLLRDFLWHHSIKNFWVYFKHFIHSPINAIRYIINLYK